MARPACRLLGIVALGLLACTESAPPDAQPPAAGTVAVQVAGHTLRVPRGFTVEVYAEGLAGPRGLALGPDGVPYVALQGAGRLVKLPDADRDGRADSVVVLVNGLNQPFGLAFRGDTLYVAESHQVVRFTGGVSQAAIVVRGLPTGGHVTRTVAFGPDGLMYVSIGSSCNLCDESDPRRAAVMRYNPDGSGGALFARGLRNSVGLGFHPTTGELWATNNDRDWLGDDRPPERINILREGRDYGWPRCNLPNVRNPEYPDADCSQVEPPAITFQAHSAPLGIRFYSGSQFPDEYHGDAFVAYHGSWNRSRPTGYKVAHVNVVDGRPESVRDFVTGFLPADGGVWGRPVDLLVLPDGTLLFSDDQGGRIFRVRWVGTPAP